MILRLQLNLEIDTTSKEMRIVGQNMVDGEEALCLAPGCGKPVRTNSYYCSQLCHRAARPTRAQLAQLQAAALAQKLA
jgi:hypothetical protein